LAIYLLGLFALCLVVGIAGQPLWKTYQRKRWAQHPFPAHWRKILRKRVPLVGRLPTHLQLQLKKHMQAFIAEKPFIACGGLRLTEEMRVVIAAQACLLVLNRSLAHFDHVRQILVYPAAFAVDRVSTDGAGVQQEHRQALAGESWSQGQVILSWQDALEGAAAPSDGRNVVIHEFAHQLDQENGAAHGAPPPSVGNTAHDPLRWKQVMGAAFSELQLAAVQGHETLLNHYGAQDPAEFFAVASETFFEQGAALQNDNVALYQALKAYYQVDPAAW
jgi:Mlc titration factor MtfA (ptsG expression regulator)